MPRPSLSGPSVWTGPDLVASRDWIRNVSTDHTAEIEAALDNVKHPCPISSRHRR